ncbi:hypothetical protein M0805_009296 [Coniferiporia weirii]|nr:hypothetical protein M0805_009296 [Coniferiporia weirii]
MTIADEGFKYVESFTAVVPRKKKKRKGQSQLGASASRSPTASLEHTMAELRSDLGWRDKCTQIIRDALDALPAEIDTVLCLGLGSPTESVQARFQLCFLLELRDTILPVHTRICAFDPVFSSQDIILLTSLGVQILPDDKNGRHVLEGPTLVFMPHCDRGLYEGLLRANWRAPALVNLLLIGNELSRYSENTPSRVLGTESPCISRLVYLVSSEQLPVHSAFPNAFSSTAVQHISAASIVCQTDVFWELAEDEVAENNGEAR